MIKVVHALFNVITLIFCIVALQTNNSSNNAERNLLLPDASAGAWSDGEGSSDGSNGLSLYLSYVQNHL